MSYCHVFWDLFFTLSIDEAITCMTQIPVSCLRNAYRTFTSFQLEREAFVQVICSCGGCQIMGAVIIVDPCCCHPPDSSPSHLKWEEARSSRENYPFKGGISSATGSTLKYSNSYLISGCLL